MSYLAPSTLDEFHARYENKFYEYGKKSENFIKLYTAPQVNPMGMPLTRVEKEMLVNTGHRLEHIYRDGMLSSVREVKVRVDPVKKIRELSPTERAAASSYRARMMRSDKTWLDDIKSRTVAPDGTPARFRLKKNGYGEWEKELYIPW